MAVESLTNLNAHKFVQVVEPPITEVVTKILLVELVGVILTLSPVISVNDVEEEENVSVFVVLCICIIPPLGIDSLLIPREAVANVPPNVVGDEKYEIPFAVPDPPMITVIRLSL